MKRLAYGTSVALLMAGLTTVAAAQDLRGWYLSGGVGYSLPIDSELESTGFSGELELDSSFGGLVALGRELGNGFRTELELGYREHDVDKALGVTATGEMRTFSAMVNGIYDIPVDGRLRPYVGVGLGYARVKADGIAPVSTTAIDDTQDAFAAQALAGVELMISETVGLGVGYRLFAAPGLDYFAANGASVDAEYLTHTVLATLRIRLGEPARPAPPPPAPMPMAQAAPPPPPPAAAPARPALPRSFQVFFDWDKSVLTDQARVIVTNAASYAKQSRVTRIVATGHTDRSGTPRYNQALSQRRAESVKAELVRNGIPANEIAIIAKGESEPLVPTADGVREAQNRRVEILLQ